MLVKKAKVVPIEAIVRGYLTGKTCHTLLLSSSFTDVTFYTGSAWTEYRASGTVHGISMPPGLIECQRLEEPIFTPSTKASEGHDENITPDQGS
jgi:phosphoribosylaminoimidazole-succinocarboxamide synthase